MAQRPIFIPDPNSSPFVKEIAIDFKWHSGMSKSQAQKSIASLHASAEELNLSPLLEISSKSPVDLGVSLSAFNLSLSNGDMSLSVECAYQGSKIFENGGPYQDLYEKSSREAKTDERLKLSGCFQGYQFFDEVFPSKPVTAFYNWLYLKALYEHSDLGEQLLKFSAFSDIVFNPSKSLNCQARAAALFVALSRNRELEKVVQDKKYYLNLIKTEQIPSAQLELPFC